MKRKEAFVRMAMKPHPGLPLFLGAVLIAAALASCTAAPRETISLASFTENYVEVSIFLEHDSRGNCLLSATFTPPDGYHLYSKDIPVTGIDGLGKPTLLELTADSQITAIGELMESVKAQEPRFEPKDLLVYPSGPVTLSLLIELPAGDGWIEEELQVTYMTCSGKHCKPPVVAKRVLVPIPSADILANE
jgi:hypothetical protein